LLGLSACSGAEWQSLYPQPPYRPPPSINVQIVARARGEGLEDAVDAFYSALSSELAAHGITSRYWQGKRPPPPPALFVVVEEWEPGSRGLRWVCGDFGCGEGSIVLYLDLRTPAPLIAGRIRGWVKSGSWGGSSANSAEAAGDEAGCAIARGESCE
jgi:hypothetical protein